MGAANVRTIDAYTKFQASPEFSVSKTVLLAESHDALVDALVDSYDGVRDDDQLALFRCVFMNPFWVDPATYARLTPIFVAVLDKFSL